MKYLSVSFIFFMLFSCKKEDENLDLKYEVLNQLIHEDIVRDKQTNDSIKYIYKSYSATKISFINLDKEKLADNEIRPNTIEIKRDSIFSSKDLDFLVSQTSPYDSRNFDLDKEKIKDKIEIVKGSEITKISIESKSVDDYWIKFRKKYGNKCLRSYSEPIFNLKKNICIIRVSESCGPLWGGGFTGIYKKVNGTWVIIDSFDHWVS